MAKPNYSFEKRQRELAKKKKKEEKANRKASPHSGDAGGQDTSAAEGQGSSASPQPAEGNTAS
jgi:hypothetical protein